jgi:hypothetical protein
MRKEKRRKKKEKVPGVKNQSRGKKGRESGLVWLVELGKRRVQGGRLYLRILASPPDHFSASVLVSPIFILLTALPNNKRVAFLLTAFTPSLPFFYFLLFFLFFIFYFFYFIFIIPFYS